MNRATLREKPATRTRADRLEARITRDQKVLFQRAAELQGKTLTNFVVSSLQEVAVRTIEDTRIIRLSAGESRVFAEALLKPRAPDQGLRAAARRYMKRIGG